MISEGRRMLPLLLPYLLCALLMDGFLQAIAAAPPPVQDILGDPLPAGATVRIGTTRLRHTDPVTTVACSPDGKWLASHCRWENYVSIWETAGGKLQRRLPVTGVAKMAFTADGNILAVVVPTSVFTGEVLVECWDLATGARLSRYRDEEPQAEEAMLAFVPGGKHLIFGTTTLRRLDWATGKLDYALPVGRITALAVSADGMTLVTANDAGVSLRDALTGKERLRVHADMQVTQLAFSPAGKVLALGGTKGQMELWDLPPIAKRTRGIALGKRPLPTQDAGSIASLTFSPDGTQLLSVTADSATFTWDVRSATLLDRRQLTSTRLVAAAFARAKQPTVITSDASSNGLSLWNLPSDGERFAERHAGRAFTCLAFSPDGKTLATGSDDKVLRFWQAGSGALSATVRLPETPCQIDFGTGGKSLVVGGAGLWWEVSVSADRTVARVLGPPRSDSTWRRAKPHEGRPLPWKIDLIDDCTLTADGFLVDLKPHKARIFEGATGQKLYEVGGRRFSAAVLAGNRRSVAVIRNEVTVSLMELVDPDIENGPGIQLDPGDRDRQSSPPPPPPPPGPGHELDTWDLDRQEMIPSRPWLLPRLALAPGGRLLAVGTPRGSILFWDLAASQQIHKLTGHDAPVSMLAFAPDGRSLACAYRDTTILVWDLSSLTLKAPTGPQPPLEQSWQGLESKTASEAWKAHWALAQGGGPTVVLLKDRLKPVRSVVHRPTAILLKELDSPMFTVRQRASKELEAMGAAAEPDLKRALASPASLETARRLQSLLARLESAHSRQIQELRAVAVLEQIATDEAYALVQTLAAGDPKAQLTRAALKSVQRQRGR